MSDASPEVWTIQRVLAWTQGHFGERGIEQPRLDAEVLLADTLGVDRLYLYTHFDQPLTPDERQRFREVVKRRAAREPVAHIRGRKEFYGREFVVSPAVLTPRPETEHLVDAVREWVSAGALAAPRLCDVGTGSGAIAVTLACELGDAQLVATDLSAAALAVARQNAAALAVADRITFVEVDLLGALPVELPPFEALVANLPYIDPGERDGLPPEVRDAEPALALFAGDGGLALIARLVAVAPAHLRAGGLLALELDPRQATRVTALLEAAGCWTPAERRRDLAGHDRVVLTTRR